jgi:hypothetical protein
MQAPKGQRFETVMKRFFFLPFLGEIRVLLCDLRNRYEALLLFAFFG